MDQRALLSAEMLRAWPLSELKYVHLEMGQQCNVRCSMCYQTDFRPSTKMPEALWRERLAPAYRFAKQLVLAGGEPTVMSNCRSLVEWALRDFPDLRFVMVTNGILLRGFWEEAFLTQGAHLNFSLNAIDPERYSRIVQFGKQKEVIANIDRLVKRKRELGVPLKLRISTVIFNDTFEEMPEFVQWAADHGLDEVLLFTDYYHTVTHPDTSYVQSCVARAYETADRHPQLRMLHLDDFDWYYAAQRRVPPVRPRPVLLKEPRHCPVAFNTLVVNSDGSAKPCCKSWYLFGNLHTATLQEVWQGKRARLFRERMLGLDFRDCLVACDLNPRPVSPAIATLRKGYWVIRRNPRTGFQKALRKFGLTSAQATPRRRSGKSGD